MTTTTFIDAATLGGIVETTRAVHNVPGLAVTVSQGLQTTSAASGTASIKTQKDISADSRFDVSCLMKFFMSTIALRLASKGQIDLEDTVIAHLPDLSARWVDIKIHHLMAHTSGYHGLDITDMNVRWNFSLEKLYNHLASAAQLSAPGTSFNYEHSEHVLLGEALRRLTGLSPKNLVQEYLLTPAGVRALTGKDCEPDEIAASHAYSPLAAAYQQTALPPFCEFWEASLPDWTISLHELARVGQLILSDTTVLEKLGMPEIQLPKMARSAARSENIPNSFSAGCGLYEDNVLGHNGSMFGQTIGIRIVPQSAVVITVGTNAWAPAARDLAFASVLAALKGTTLQSPTIASKLPSEEDIFGALNPDDVCGDYIGSYLGVVHVARNGDTIHLRIGPSGKRQTNIMINVQEVGCEINSAAPILILFEEKHGNITLFLGVHSYAKIAN